MKKYFVTLSLTLLSCFICSNDDAHSEIYSDDIMYPVDDCSSFYAKISGGANFIQSKTLHDSKDHYKVGYLASSSIGFRWNTGISLEAEYAFRRNCLKNVKFEGHTYGVCGSLQTSSLMANLLWDLPLSCSLNPYVGGGIGYDFHELHASYHNYRYKFEKNAFAWQFIGGVKYPIFSNADLSLEYKFHSSNLKGFHDHSVALGVTCKFGPFFQ